MTVDIEERIRALYQKHGYISPDLVIEDAKDDKSPLHECFEWDVNKAALETWRDTARTLIRSVRVIRSIETVEFRAEGHNLPEFVRDPSRKGDEQGYVRTAELRNDRDRAIASIMMEISRAEAAIARARNVAEALGLSEEVRLVRSAILTMKSKIPAV